jgi:hypothetical protein
MTAWLRHGVTPLTTAAATDAVCCCAVVAAAEEAAHLWHVCGALPEVFLALALLVDQHHAMQLPYTLAASKDVHQRRLAST